MTDVVIIILPLRTLGRLVGVISDVNQTFLVVAVVCLRYRLVG